MKKKVITLCMTLILVFGLCSTASATTVQTTHWYDKCVAWGVNNHIILNEHRKPNQAITRGETFRMIASYEMGVYCNDLSVANWYCKQRLITDGDNINNNLTREQYATMLYRMVKDDWDAQYIDLSRVCYDSSKIHDWAYLGVSTMYCTGIMRGNDLLMFNPQGNVTQAEALTTLMRIEALKRGCTVDWL